MFTLCNVVLACGVAYLGAQGLAHYRAKQNKSWLLKPGDHLQRDLKPGSTRIYIVRAWQEKGFFKTSGIARYALEEPSTGRRYGFANSNTLLEGLSRELTQMQARQAEETGQAQNGVVAVPALAP